MSPNWYEKGDDCGWFPLYVGITGAIPCIAALFGLGQAGREYAQLPPGVGLDCVPLAPLPGRGGHGYVGDVTPFAAAWP